MSQTCPNPTLCSDMYTENMTLDTIPYPNGWVLDEQQNLYTFTNGVRTTYPVTTYCYHINFPSTQPQLATAYQGRALIRNHSNDMNLKTLSQYFTPNQFLVTDANSLIVSVPQNMITHKVIFAGYTINSGTAYALSIRESTGNGLYHYITEPVVLIKMVVHIDSNYASTLTGTNGQISVRVGPANSTSAILPPFYQQTFGPSNFSNFRSGFDPFNNKNVKNMFMYINSGIPTTVIPENDVVAVTLDAPGLGTFDGEIFVTLVFAPSIASNNINTLV